MVTVVIVQPDGWRHRAVVPFEVVSSLRRTAVPGALVLAVIQGGSR